MPRSPRKEGYSRPHRFTVQGSFSTVLRASRKLRGRYTVVHVAAGRPEHSRLGIALTRRLVPRSVDRNRVKRLVREAFRRHMLKRAGLDCVVALREKFDGASLGLIAAEVRQHFDQLVQTPSR
jgi:ribonuclease P protein component